MGMGRGPRCTETEKEREKKRDRVGDVALADCVNCLLPDHAAVQNAHTEIDSAQQTDRLTDRETVRDRRGKKKRERVRQVKS